MRALAHTDRRMSERNRELRAANRSVRTPCRSGSGQPQCRNQ